MATAALGSCVGCVRFTICFFLLVCVIQLATPAEAQTPQKPHILYIVADDLGWKDVGYHSSDIKTPNIDRLAETGARLEQFYAQPMCTPTRAALMTGRYPFRYGLQTAVILGGHKYGLPTEEFLLPQVLKESGYTTAIIGKWHLGHADQKYWPRQRGFDYQYGPLIGEIDHFKHESNGVRDWYKNNEPLTEEGYSTTLIGNEAVRFINAHSSGTPLYLYLAFNAPHSPYQVPQEYMDRYPTIADPTRRTYAGMVSAMDDQIGRVLEALQSTGMRNNTLIVFQSDNGGTSNPMFAGEVDVSKIKIPCDNGPYREGKGSLYEGGTRVPALVNWPGHVRPGVVDGMMHVVDMFPTLAHFAGASTLKAKPLDGMDMSQILTQGAPSPRTEVVYNLEALRVGIRQGDWKLVWNTPLPSVPELYNIAQDPSEKSNRASGNADRVAQLQKRAYELAAQMAPSGFITTEFNAIRERVHMPPALAGRELQFDQEP